MNQLAIVVNTNVEPRTFRLESLPTVINYDLLNVSISFTLKNGSGKTIRSMTIYMEARYRGTDDDRLRDELLRNARTEREMWPTADDFQPGNDLQIDIIDPTGVLKWFGIDQAVEIFKTKSNADKSVRFLTPRAD